jgi:hypothetical protein
MVSEIQLDRDAVAYIRRYLAEGFTLSHALLQLALETGTVVTYLPTTTSPDTRKQFAAGGILPAFSELESQYVDVNGQGERLVQVTGNPIRQEIEALVAGGIATYLHRPGRRYAVFEHALARPTDPWLETANVKFFYCQAEVYLFLTVSDDSLATIIKAKRAAQTYVFTGVLVAGEDLPDLTSGQVVDTDVLQLLAARTEHIIVGAYDGEGELVWSKQ